MAVRVWRVMDAMKARIVRLRDGCLGLPSEDSDCNMTVAVWWVIKSKWWAGEVEDERDPQRACRTRRDLR